LIVKYGLHNLMIIIDNIMENTIDNEICATIM